jgi:uncharacterized glyoxalase superfamily protein PhnB
MGEKFQGRSTVSPYLLLRDAEKTMRFAEAVFGATRLLVHERPDGAGIMHAELRIGDSVVMMGEVSAGQEAHLHVYVEDVRHVFDRARQAGARVLQEPLAKGDGDLRAGVADGNGIVWWIGQRQTAD